MVGGEATACLPYTPQRSAPSTKKKCVAARACGDISFALEHIDKAEKLDYLAYYDQLTALQPHVVL